MRAALAFTAILPCLTGAPASLSGQERSLAIQSFTAGITVNPDATIDVAETIAVRFTGSWNGIYRTIPVVFRTPQGFNWTIKLSDYTITDEHGAQLETEVRRVRHYLKFKIRVPGAQDAVRTVVLRYKAADALRFFEEHDELYWNVTGDEWDVPIEAAAATIRLPGNASGVRATAFDGSYGSTAQNATVEATGTTIQVTMPKPLGFREGLTAVVGWNKGAVTPPAAVAKTAGFLLANWPLLIPFPVFLLMWRHWRRRGRDPDPHPVAVQYEPPEELSPAETGTLLDNTVDMRDITATLVDLAVRGFLRIEERERSAFLGLVKEREFAFVPTKPRREWTSLKPHEQTLLQGVFINGDRSVLLSDLEQRFYRSIPGIQSQVYDGLIERGLYPARPDGVRGRWLFGAAAAGMVIGVGGAIVAGSLLLSPIPFIVGGVLTALAIGGFGFFMPARTVAGARTQEKIQGFAEFLERVEGDRYRDFVKTPETFERFLAFAMAFGVEKQWARAFKDIYTTPPTWYAGTSPTAFNVTNFSGRMAEMSTEAASSFASAPRSSSGSGFSGGGSSGGGGGGGGGGGW